MPKKQLTDSLALDEAAPSFGFAGWQATGLALAAAAMATYTGLGTLASAAVLAPIVYALVRLRRHAPEAASTAELVGSTLGLRGAAFARILQVTGYVLIAVTAAQTFGLLCTPLHVTDDPYDPVRSNPWLWSLWAIAALVVAAVLVFALPARVVAGIAAVLALGGLLVHFYYALAVVAHGLAGTVPEQPVGPEPPTGLAAAGTLAVATVTLAGFEVVTARARRGSSGGWPMSLAIGFVTLVAVIVWWATQYGGNGAGSLGSSTFGLDVGDLYGDTGTKIVAIASATFVFAALLALLWGIGAVTERFDVGMPADAVFGGVVVLAAVLAVAVIHAGWTLGYVGGLVLFTLYAVVLVANSKVAADSVVTWWLRIVMPAVFAALVLLPLAWAEFSASSLTPVIIAALLVAAAAAAAILSARRRPD